MSTRVRAIGAVAAIVLLTGGCAAGIHPGAAAVVGKTEISVGDVDKTSQAVSTALGQNYNTAAALSDLVNNAVLGQVQENKSVPVTPAETAEAARSAVGGDEDTYQKFQTNTVARDFLNSVATSQVVVVKLAGGTVKDLQDQAKLQQGLAAAKDASKDITVSIAPRFGQWTDGKLDTTISGSLSVESDQTAAKRKAAADAAQQAQPQG
ncbi:hypothetical protein [Kribbella sp. NPDC000426]|uniref:hypothetical protein n=1 Tax=Kribbella sp. NPDC000426 TaxID=3154255 RepID=UPI00332A786C